jgi:hypothetical protein
MGAHFTNHSSQLGVLVLAGLIVDADQGVFDGLRHECVRLGSIARMVSSPAGSTAELEWELEIQGHKDGMMTLSAMVAWPTGRNWVRADRFGERRKAFSRCLFRGGSIDAGTRQVMTKTKMAPTELSIGADA